MLDEILDDEKFALLMKMHVYECIDFLLEKGLNFSVMANLPLVSFEPSLPDEISGSFSMPVIMFSLGGYTLESARLTQDELSFEAGFGSENFASVVSFPLGAVVNLLLFWLINGEIYKDRAIFKTQKIKIYLRKNSNFKHFWLKSKENLKSEKWKIYYQI